MDIKEKIVKALVDRLGAEYVRLQEDDGVSGFVVSPMFEGRSALDRQALIDDVLTKGAEALTSGELRDVLMIAALTPIEYEAVGSPIRVCRIREIAGGALEVLLDGGPSDAQHVRGALNHHKGIQTTEPKRVAGDLGVLMSFRVKGTGATALTKDKAIRALRKDPYIEVMPNA